MREEYDEKATGSAVWGIGVSGECMGFTNMEECDLFYKWQSRKEKKQALVNSSVISTPVAEDEVGKLFADICVVAHKSHREDGVEHQSCCLKWIQHTPC